MVGTENRLKVHQATDVVANEERMKAIQYYASVEDNLYPFAPVEDFGFFTISDCRRRMSRGSLDGREYEHNPNAGAFGAF
jgi:hypothetical protein